MEKEILDLCVGLDIGTSTTKVVIHPLFADDSFFVVDFEKDKTEDATYLLPTKLAINLETKQFELPLYRIEQEIPNFFERLASKFSNVTIKKKIHQQKIFNNLKVNFMNNEENSADYLRVFIALVIQYSKEWFVKKYGNRDFMKNKEIIWSINMGIPSAKFSSTGNNKKYLSILKTAYNLSKKSRIDLSNYKKVDDSDPDIEYSVIPEIVAAVSSFVTQEDSAAQGLYCAIDIGAGTTDICTFRIHRDEAVDIYSFFKSSVLELGADRYYEALNKVEIEKNFFGQLGSVIWRTQRYRDPNADEWESYLPLIICGGGSYIKAYKDVIHNYERDILIKQLSHRGFKGYRSIVLPDTQYIHTSESIDPKRLLVAQGLCFSTDFYDDIKKYYAETEIEDIPRKQKKEFEEITKDVC